MKEKAKSASVRLFIFLLVLGLLSLFIFLWWKDGIASVDVSDTTPVMFVIKKGETVRNIASRLSVERLVRSRTAFFLLVKMQGLDGKIQAGDFRLNRSMTAEEIAKELTIGIVDVWVTLLEGWRAEEIATKVAGELGIPEQEFLKHVQEGYLFPDTYLLPKDASSAGIIEVFRNNFDTRVTEEMKEDGKKLGLTLDQIVTLASIIEREGRNDTDRPIIAGILLNRLNADWPLQADATLQYALGYQPGERTWWKKALSNEDKKIDSLYNTYKNKGLPPAPIANPGLSSIKAVIYYQDSEYWFYIHDQQGQAHYARTIEEHETNIEKYLR